MKHRLASLNPHRRIAAARPLAPRAASAARAGLSDRGFGAIAAIVVLVILASLAAAVVRLASSQSTGQALDVQAMRAYQAANAGVEWGLYQALKGSWSGCSGATHTTDLSADLGMRVTITCNSRSYNEGADSVSGNPLTVRLYTIDAVACNSSTSCPDASRATSPTYVERHRQVQATG
jgi:MSHA biogenesis protein MshP